MSSKSNFKWIYFLCICIFICQADRIHAQQKSGNERTIIGRVSDSFKKTLHGVIVEASDKNRRAMTNKDGQYNIEVSAQDSVLLFSSAGYVPQKVKLGKSSVVNITLKENNSTLNEVLNLGYYAVKKRNADVAVGAISAEDLSDVPVTRFQETLSGRMAGLKVNSPQGQPGDPLNFVIRGENTLHDASPLFVVDGIPVENLNGLFLNTHDIKNMTVLKDASLLALYGSRGANGVIVIETKRGYAGKSSIQFNSFLGVQDIAKRIDMMEPYDFVQYQLESIGTTAKALYTPADLAPGDPLYDAAGRTLEDYHDITGIDWQDKIFRVAPIQYYNLSIAGGDTNTKFIASTSLSSQKGTVINSGARTYQGRLGLTQRIGRYINSGLDINYGQSPRYGQTLNFDDNNLVSDHPLSRMWGARSVSGSHNIDILTPFLDPEYEWAPNVKYNPIIALENEDKRNSMSNLLAHAYLEADILSNLKARVQGSFVSDKTRATAFYNSTTPLGAGPNGMNGNSLYNKTKYNTVDLTLSYSEVFDNVHSLDVLGGFFHNRSLSESYGYDIELLPNEDAGVYGFDEGIPVYTLSRKWEDRFSSYFARGTYSFKNRYFLTGVFRADEGFNKKLGYSPAAGVSWDMKEEHFLRSSKVVSHARLRASYGRSGVRPKNPLTIIFTSNIAVPSEFAWESVDQLDIGYDMGLWDDRLILNLDYYDKVNSTDPMYFSMARIENKGFEVSISSLNIDRTDFKWRSNFNISFNRNRVLAMRNHTSIMSTLFFAESPLYITTPGEQLGAFHGYRFDGVYQVEDFDYNGGIYTLKSNVSGNGSFRGSIQPGDIRYKDINADGFVDEDDKVTLGNSLPKYFGGFSNSLTYKAFDLNIFLQWSYGNKIFNANRMAFEGNYLEQAGLNQYASYTERWTPENRSNTLFRTGGQGESDMMSDRTLEDGSYLRFKTVSLGYTLPKRWMNAKNLKNLRLFVTGQNLITFTKYTGMDPEVSIRHSIVTQGFDYAAYPQFRTLAFGLNATF